jgi:hypothetical protein
MTASGFRLMQRRRAGPPQPSVTIRTHTPAPLQGRHTAFPEQHKNTQQKEAGHTTKHDHRVRFLSFTTDRNPLGCIEVRPRTTLHIKPLQAGPKAPRQRTDVITPQQAATFPESCLQLQSDQGAASWVRRQLPVWLQQPGSMWLCSRSALMSRCCCADVRGHIRTRTC